VQAHVQTALLAAGCLNGGGQIKVPGGHSAAQQLVKDLDELYHDKSAVMLNWPGEDMSSAAVLAQLQLSSAGMKQAFHTQFHQREKNLQSAVSDW
jgi:hypothetical protein